MVNNMSRRKFLKLVGVGTLAVTSGLLLESNFENIVKFLEEGRNKFFHRTLYLCH
jgi:anaerobic selenocysteine-containing dehydrogenase